MSKQSKQPSVPSFIDSHWSDHPLAEWISNNKQLILWSLAALLAILLIAAKFLISRNSNAESDYLKAQTDFTKFQISALSPADKATSSTTLDDLEVIMKSYPELHAKYDAPIAQTLIIKDQVSKAKPFAEATFRRTKNDHIKNYHLFAENSLLISEGEYQKALLKSQQLQEILKADSSLSSASTLYLFNLIRLAFLHQQLGNIQEEANIWQEFQHLPSQPTVSELLTLFTQGNANLNQYIQKRKT